MRMLWDVVVPSATPELLNGIRTALALSFILLVSSELIVAREGLGLSDRIARLERQLRRDVCRRADRRLLGFAADRVYLLLLQRMLRWQA